MSKLTQSDLVASSQWQYWIARVFPMLYITTITLLLPTILTQSFVISELGFTQERKLQQRLRSISIKILADGEAIGSGVILVKQDQVYTVITNSHVIQAASVPFQLQTPDGKVYAAALITPPIGQNRDLSILRFQSQRQTYTAAKLAPTSPKIGDRVWSAGFPLDHPHEATTAVWTPNIVSGEITQILPIALSGGYRIGADHLIDEGMNGGPLLNQSGELIGINGIHVDPLWNTPEYLEDGSVVTKTLQMQINNSSWAIPTEFIKDYAKLY